MKIPHIQSIRGLQRRLTAKNNRFAVLYKRDYVLHPALELHLARYRDLAFIQDEAARYEAFRALPALECDLEAVDADLTPAERTSPPQKARAQKSRSKLTTNGMGIDDVIAEILAAEGCAHKANHYWPLFVARLTELGLQPVTIDSRSDNERIAYGPAGGWRRRIGQRAFENRLSRIRRGLRLH